MRKIKKTLFVCDKCGKKIEYENEHCVEYEQTWNLSSDRQAGYGSKLDGMYIDFDICDDCLYEFLTSFKNEDVFTKGW